MFKTAMLCISFFIAIVANCQTTFLGFDTTVCGNSVNFYYTFVNSHYGGGGSSSGSQFTIFRNGIQVHNRFGFSMSFDDPTAEELIFINDSVGFLAYSLAGAFVYIDKTTDYGNTWTRFDGFQPGNPWADYVSSYIVNEHTSYLIMLRVPFPGLPSQLRVRRNSQNTGSGSSGTILFTDTNFFGTVVIHDTINGLNLCGRDTLKMSFSHNSQIAYYHFILHQTLTSINEKEIISSKIKTYPNPSSNFFSIINLPKKTTNIQLYSMNGSLIKNYNAESRSINKFDIKGIDQGIYLINIITNNSSSTHKLIISH
jgi:hypothetical protein